MEGTKNQGPAAPVRTGPVESGGGFRHDSRATGPASLDSLFVRDETPVQSVCHPDATHEKSIHPSAKCRKQVVVLRQLTDMEKLIPLAQIPKKSLT